MKYPNLREEEIKNKVAQDYFSEFDCTRIVGNLDFCVSVRQLHPGLFAQESLMWAEAKRGVSDIYSSMVQLILTIGKARTFDRDLPPQLLGAFDAEKIAFLPYSVVHEVFYRNDFNWNVAPSDHSSKEFKIVLEITRRTIEQSSLKFDFEKDSKELRQFIRQNFASGIREVSKIKIDKNNFMVVYNKWLEAVKPKIAVNWQVAKKSGIIDGDFYLADLLSRENSTLKEKLFVLLKQDHYELDRKIDEAGMFSSKRTDFTDKQVAHIQFWNHYERPPKEEYWDYIVERRDLLVPQDVRERKGSFFTPQKWVELSQKYLANCLGEDWQDEYYIWDCAAGTGNLLAGLTNKYNIWASTLDSQDVEVMHDRIKNGANLLDDHVFQFDFLNDPFSKLPAGLQSIVNDPKKRERLVIYINPPYAEVSSKAVKGKVGVNLTAVHQKYGKVLGTAGRELYAQFFVRIYAELKGTILGEFSKLKAIEGAAFDAFRTFFLAKLESCFVVPANTFDNVTGQFPIGFKIWNTGKQEKLARVKADVYDRDGTPLGHKTFYTHQKLNYINKWISRYKKSAGEPIGFMDGINGNDFQHNNIVYITNSKETLPNPRGIWITKGNLLAVSVYLAVRKSIPATWINDRDQFLTPSDDWIHDVEFKSDCLTYTLFTNNIQSRLGINHWIPFTEAEVEARDKFESNLMTDFLKGKVDKVVDADLFLDATPGLGYGQLTFSSEAKHVFEVGRKLWRYYHTQPDCNVNASLYDIKSHFQGKNESGKMNSKSDDPIYSGLIAELKSGLGLLEMSIGRKCFSYGFLLPIT